MKSLLLLLLTTCCFELWSQNLTADFEAPTLEVCIGNSVSFSDLSIAGGSPIQTWTWDFGDGFSSLIQNPTHTYTLPGTYNVTLTVQALDGTSDVEVKSGYIIIHPLPVVDFSIVELACTLPFNATFSNSSSAGNEYDYQWNFGNGQTSTDYIPSGIVYNSIGTYTVNLIVTNTNTSCINMVSQTIDVNEFSTGIIAPDTVCVGANVLIEDGSTAGATSWQWNFGNGNQSSTQNNYQAYLTPGVYTITLNSTNVNLGCSDSTSHDIVVLPTPTADFTVDEVIGCSPMTINFANLSSGATQFSWDFGDGTSYTGTTPPPHVYSDTGSYTVTLFASDDNGCSSYKVETDLIRVDPIYPGFTFLPGEGCTPLGVSFVDTTSVPNPNDPIVSWQWNFGNGSTYSGQFPPAQTYLTGLYDVELIITTSTGCTADTIYADSVQVGEIDTVAFTYSPTDVCAKEDVSFLNNSVISVSHDPSEVEYFWDFGDGGVSGFENPTYQYAQDTGYFTVNLIVNFRGCLDTATVTDAVHVNAPISKFNPSTSLVCNPTSFPVNIGVNDVSIIGLISDDAEMIWNWGDGTSTLFDDPDFDDADQGSTSHDYTALGSYTIEHIIHNYDTGCSDTNDFTIHISEIIADFSYANDSICFGDITALLDNSTSSHPVLYDTLLNYYSLGDGNIQYGQFITHDYTTYGSYDIVHYVMNNVGCTDTDTLFGYDVLALPQASLLASDPAGCAPLSVVFTNQSSVVGNGAPLASFDWTFEDGSITTTTNIAQTTNYLFDQEGLFNTSLQAVDEFGCVSPITLVSTDITKPTAAFNVDSILCNNSPFTSTNGSSGDGPLQYEWFVDGISSGNNTSYTNQFDEVASSSYDSVLHLLELVVTDVNGCTDTVTTEMIVSLPHADANFAFSGATINGQGQFDCPPVFATFTDTSNSYGAVTDWNWTFGNGNGSTLEDPSNTYVFAGTYTATFNIVDEYGCTDDTTFLDFITINGPSGNPTWVNTGTFCDPNYLFYVENANNINNVNWDFGNGVIVNGMDSVEYVYPVNGTYVPTALISDDSGCEILYTLPIINHSINDLNAFFTSSMLEGEVSEIFTLDDESTYSTNPIVQWHWDFGESSQTNYSDELVDYGWNYTGTQTATLTVSDINGCSDSYSINVLISAEFVVPNVFSPNGDGANDLFHLDFDVFNGYDYTIVNRWGQIIVSEEGHSGVILWDGKTQGGKECSDGVYFYIITGRLYDETEIVKHGNVTLVR